MNITFLIGNGFDVNLGLKTQYVHFYEHYKKIKSENPIIDSFKSKIYDGYEFWGDLELALGEYTSYLRNSEEFDTLYEDIQSELAKYIESQEKRFIYDDEDIRQQLINDIYSSERVLLPRDKQIIESVKYDRNTEIEINIITFNYTTTIEKLLTFNGRSKIGVTPSGRNIMLNEIVHIHGYTYDRMILGVNDASQIANTEFREDANITSALIKPICNDVQKHMIDEKCTQIISNTDLFCLYGLSMGETDGMWWSQIGKRLNRSDSRMIIYYWDNEKYPVNQGYKIKRKEKEVFDLFKLRSKNETITNDKFFLSHNSNLFNFKLKTNAALEFEESILKNIKITKGTAFSA